MPKLTTQDMSIRANWSGFLHPLLGDGPGRVPIPKLSVEIDKIAGRVGDNRAELYEYTRYTPRRTPRAKRVFEVGEALRICGVTWASGPLALYAAGYLAEWVEATAAVIPFIPLRRAASRSKDVEARSDPSRARETAVLLAVFAPLAVLREHNLKADLGDKAESWRANARNVLTAALEGAPIEMLRSAFEERSSRLTAFTLAPIAEMARYSAFIPGNSLVESLILNAMREWAFLDAPAPLRSRIADIQLQLQLLRAMRLQDDVDKASKLDRLVESGIRGAAFQRAAALILNLEVDPVAARSENLSIPNGRKKT
jgi:hypothetical protein